MLHKPPCPCPPNNPHCSDVPGLSIDDWIIFMILIAIIYGYIILKRNKTPKTTR